MDIPKRKPSRRAAFWSKRLEEWSDRLAKMEEAFQEMNERLGPVLQHADDESEEVAEITGKLLALWKSLDHDMEDLPVSETGGCSDHAMIEDENAISYDERCTKCRIMSIYMDHNDDISEML